MKKIIFPFNQKYQNLKIYWWHRLTTVLFIIVVFLIGVYVWQFSLKTETAKYFDCQRQNDLLKIINIEKCLGFVHPFLDFCIGLLVSVLVFYFLQFLYYKVILYIVFGKRK